MPPPLQSELQKQNALSVLITELQANGRGDRLCNLFHKVSCGHMYVHNGEWKWQTGHVVSSAKSVEDAKHLKYVNN